ncbi:MAG: hypothetical protein H6822_30155 [Planctomycetaceae bacterium]|nr:hypothetical protein [Planctomycetales bacterium]MCB9926447.1 hypothetical protein [Planctomycetaceae bacterium]
MDIIENLTESDIHLTTTVFPSGERDFCLWKTSEAGVRVPINPLELLVLDRAVDVIDEQARSNEPRAMNQALCRLLVPSVKTKRVGRHLVIEPWSAEAIRGETLADETGTSFAVELSQAQAEQWRVVQHSEENPSGLLEEVFWDAITELPSLQRQFDDPDLGKFGKALYHHLIPPGEGREVVECWSNLTKEIERCRADDFRDLGLGFDRNYVRQLYRKYMAVTIRWTSKMTAKVARSVIDALHDDITSLSPSEQVMHELRYGAAECFGKINVGFLFGCGPMFECFFNDIYRSIASEGAQSENCEAMNELLRFVYLQRHYFELRKHARRDEKQQQRTKYQDSYPGERESPASLIDPGARSPHDLMAISEEMLILQDEILPAMEREKPKQAKLLRLFIEHAGNVDAIADATGLSDRQVTRQLKETVFRTAQRTARRLKFPELLED